MDYAVLSGWVCSVFAIQTLGVSKEKCWKKTESFFGTKTNNIKASYSRNTDPKGTLQTNETNSKKIYNIVKKIL